MSLDLDDETLEALGYARPEGELPLPPRSQRHPDSPVPEVLERLGNSMAVVRDRDIGTRDIDGRHRRNWRHRRR